MFIVLTSMFPSYIPINFLFQMLGAVFRDGLACLRPPIIGG